MNPPKQVLATVIVALLVLSVLAGTIPVPAGTVGAEPGPSTQSGSLTECRTIDRSGTYTLQNDIQLEERSTCFEVTASDVVIDGRGNSVFNGAGTAVRVAGTEETPLENVTIRNLRATVLEGGVTVTNARNVTISNNEFESNDGTAIIVGDAASGAGSAAGVLVEDNIVEDNTRGIVLGRGAARAEIVDNDVVENREAGLLVRNVPRTTVRANVFSANDGGRTLHIAGDSPHSRIENNVVEDSGTGYGISIQGTSSNATLLDNAVRNNPQGGVKVVPDGNTLRGNTISDNGVGVHLEGSSNNRLRDNRVYANDEDEYRSTNGSTGNEVTDLSLDSDNETVVSFDVSQDVALRHVPEENRPAPPEEFDGGDAWLGLNTTSENGYVLLNVSYNESTADREKRLGLYDRDDGRWAEAGAVSGRSTDEGYVYAYVTESGVLTPLNGDGDLTPLTAVATITPSPSFVGERVTLDASESRSDSPIGRYQWDIRNDGQVEHTVETVERRFDAPGTYDVALTVGENPADKVVVQHVVRADTASPVAIIDDGDRRVYTDRTVTFDGSNSHDDVGIASYEWAFGDGSEATGATVSHSFTAQSGATPSEVTLTVTDRLGNTSSTTVNVTAVPPEDDDASPAADAGPDRNAVVESRVTLDGSGSTDDVDIGSYEWDIGDDGSVDATGATPSVSFTENGTVEVALTVTDGGGNNDTDTLTVTVTENDTQPPIADAGPDRRVRADESTTFDGSGSTDDAGVISGYKWQMGDGTVKYGETVRHAYSAPGTYNVTLTVTDGGGSTAAETTTVVVSSGPPAVTDTRTSSERGAVSIPPANPTLIRTEYPTPREARSTIETARGGTAVRLGYDFERRADDCHVMEEVTVSSNRPGDRELAVRHLNRSDDEVPPFTVEESGPAFGFFVVNHSQPEAYSTPATFRFSVASSCLDDRGVSPSGVALYRYTDGGWVRLDTTQQDPRVGEEVRYAAASSGLSVLAVGTEPTEPDVTPTPTPTEPTPTPTGPTPTPEPPTPEPPTPEPPTATPVGPTPTPEEPTDTTGEGVTDTGGTNTSTSTVNFVGQPGLGVVVAVLALLGAALLASRRRAP